MSGPITAGVVKDLINTVVLAADGTPFTSAALCVIRLEQDGDGDDGLYWDSNDDTWQAAPVAFPVSAHTEAGQHLFQLPAAATSGRDGARIVVTFTDTVTEGSMTTLCGTKEYLVEELWATAANVATAESNIRGTDSRDLTDLTGAGWVAADNLTQAHNKLDALQADIDNFSNITKVKVSLPIFETPPSGSLAYEFFFNLKDDAGDPVDADVDVTLVATAHGGVSGDRDLNLDSTTMTNIGVGRYRGVYNVASSHALEGIHLAFSWAEGGNADVLDKSFTVIDSDMVGYLASDRTRDDAIAVETTAIDGRLPSDPADESLQQAAHAQTQADIAASETAVRGTDGDDLKVLSDQIDGVAVPGSAMTLTSAERDAIADVSWDELLAGHTVAGSTGQQLTDIKIAIINVLANS